MLPDVPGLKKEIHRLMQKEYEQEIRSQVPILELMHHHSIHEGRSYTYSDVDGVVRDGSPRPVETVFTVSVDEVLALGPADVRDKFRTAAADMSRQMSETLLDMLNQMIEEVGNVERGRSFDQETLLRALEKIHIDFGPDGRPHLPTLLAGPEMVATMQEKLAAWQQDEEFNRRWAELMARKRQEWRDRESNRALVD